MLYDRKYKENVLNKVCWYDNEQQGTVVQFDIKGAGSTHGACLNIRSKFL